MKTAMTPPQRRRLKQARSRLVAGLPRWNDMIRGTLMRYLLTCGRKNCRCHRSKKDRHGPYWYVAVAYGKGRRQKMILVSPEQRRKAAEGIRAYKALWKKLCRISEINLNLLRRG